MCVLLRVCVHNLEPAHLQKDKGDMSPFEAKPPGLCIMQPKAKLETLPSPTHTAARGFLICPGARS